MNNTRGVWRLLEVGALSILLDGICASDAEAQKKVVRGDIAGPLAP